MKAVCKKIMPGSFKVGPLALAIALSGCGGVGQDTSTLVEPGEGQVFSGLAIDGYLARATVYLDTNNNGTRDSWEPFAFTDNEGYYSYNPNTDTNYCAADATAQEKQYCLVSSLHRSEVVVRIDGGYDVQTGEPFMGQLSRRLTNIGESEETVNTLVSPITTLLTSVASDRQSTVLSNLDLSQSDVDVDYLNVSGTNAADMRILNTAVKVHKVVAVLSDRLTDTYDEIGESFGTPNDATPDVYKQVAKQLSIQSNSLNTVLSDDTQLGSILISAEDSLRQVYQRRGLDMPQGTVNQPRATSVAKQVARVVDSVLNAEQLVSSDHSRIRGATRALESVVIKAIEENDNQDSSIETSVSFLTNATQTNEVNTLLDVLAEENVDVSALVRHNFDQGSFSTEEQIRSVVSLGDQVEKFTSLAGKQMRVSDLDLGWAPDNLKDMELEVYFSGEVSDVSGSFTACAKFIDDANIDGTLGEGNTRGELLNGYWSMLGSTGAEGSYSILLTIEFLGATYQAIMKSVGPTTIDGVDYKQIRFDNDGDYRIWHSPAGLVETVNLPTTNKECEERLPSRVNI